MMPKRILVVCQHFWPEAFRINDICTGFAEYGYEVEVLCGIPNYPKGQFYDGYGYTSNRRQTYNSIEVRRCFEIKRGTNTNHRIFLNYMSFPISSTFSIPFLLRQKYDKIFLYQLSPVIMSFSGILLGKIKNIETVMYVLDLWPENLYTVLNIKSKLLRKVVESVSNWHYCKTDKLIANSQKLQSILQERTGKHIDKLTYIPQFCEKIYETSIVDKKLTSRFAATFNLVFTGNISPAQSFDTVINAAVILRYRGFGDIKWIIVGDGMSRSWLESEVKEKGLDDYFIFIGQVAVEEIPKYTCIADCLFACLSKSELLDCALPAKVFSYYAAGRPLVFAMDGEIQYMVKESRAGYIVDSEDHEGLAGAIVELYNTSEEERMKMGKNARMYYYANFEREKNMEKIIQFMEK